MALFIHYAIVTEAADRSQVPGGGAVETIRRGRLSGKEIFQYIYTPTLMKTLAKIMRFRRDAQNADGHPPSKIK